MLDAVKFGHENFVKIIKGIEKDWLRKQENQNGKLKRSIILILKRRKSGSFEKDLRKAFQEIDKKEKINCYF